MTGPGDIDVAVAFAPTPEEQRVVPLRVARGTTVGEVITASGILAKYPAMDVAHLAVGIFGERVSLTQVLEQGDRVEIYRPLIADPKEARRHRARRRLGN